MSLASAIAFVLATMLAGLALPATAADPPVPIGLDPGGPAIALITDGIDYTDPEIAKRLARDGEGELIAFDLVDGDIRPYAPAGQNSGSELLKALLSAHPKARIVVARASMEDPVSVAKAMIFASRTPAKVTAVALNDIPPEMIGILDQAANAAPAMIFALPPTFNATKAANLFKAPPPDQTDPAGSQVGQHIAAMTVKLSCLLEHGTPVSDLRKMSNPNSTCDPATGEISFKSGSSRF